MCRKILVALGALLSPIIVAQTPKAPVLYIDGTKVGADVSAPVSLISLGPCAPLAGGRDFQVGPASGQLAGLENVPWESLRAGDTVRIFYRSEPYRGKFLIAASGTASAPVRICGVKGPNGERPIISGSGAVTRSNLSGAYGSSGTTTDYNESRGVIFIDRLRNAPPYEAFASYIRIDGLAIRQAHPSYSFTNAAGQSRSYIDFGACIWIERGHNIVIADNEISDCNQGIFSRSAAEGDFSVTRDIQIAGNYFSNNGIAGAEGMHTLYIQSIGVTYEFNYFGAMRASAGGNAIKDRSAGTVVRFNRIESGAHAIDLVEAQDYDAIAKADPRYYKTYVYGNQILKNGKTGTTIHYGGDHNGSEAAYRKGTLYFWNNTVRITGGGYAVLFQLSTTEEHAEVWNNIFVFDDDIQYPSMRAMQENAAGYTAGGILNLGKNWISSRWADSDPYHAVTGQLLGTENLVKGTTPPIDTVTFAPKAGSAVIDAAQANLSAVSSFSLNYQLDDGFVPKARTVNGSASDLGAREY